MPKSTTIFFSATQPQEHQQEKIDVKQAKIFFKLRKSFSKKKENGKKRSRLTEKQLEQSILSQILTNF